MESSGIKGACRRFASWNGKSNFNQMIILVPAILSRDPEEVREKIRLLESVPEITEVQIDFEDGRFVENQTVLPGDLGHLETRLKIEAHLMVKDPPHYFDDLEILPAELLFLHFESFSRLSDLLTAISNARALGFRCGVAINPATELSAVESFAQETDAVLLMSVNPGWQGQKFLPQSLERLQELRKNHGGLTLEIDGGVNLDNFGAVAAHGANRIVVGSAIWQSADPRATIYDFLGKLK